jgi:hypothetical protein
MPKQSIEVFCKYEADDGVAPLGHDGLSPGVEEGDREAYQVSKQISPSKRTGRRQADRTSKTGMLELPHLVASRIPAPRSCLHPSNPVNQTISIQ